MPTRILKTLNQSFEIIEMMKMCFHFPSEENVTDYLNRMCFNFISTSILKFQHTNEENNYFLISEIYKELEKFVEGNNLILIGYSLFSQMNVGLLKLVARFFRQLIFQPDNKLGYVIILSHYISENNNNISRNEKNNFKQLVDFANAAKLKETIVLSVFSMLDLYGKKYESEFLKIIKNENEILVMGKKIISFQKLFG